MPLRCEGCSQEADRGRAFCAEQQQQSKKKKKKKALIQSNEKIPLSKTLPMTEVQQLISHWLL